MNVAFIHGIIIPMEITYRFFSSPEAKLAVDQMMNVYQSVYSRPPYNETEEQFLRVRKTWSERCDKDGFLFLGAESSDSEMMGFAFGWSSVPGGKFHERVKGLLSEEESQYWLKSCFEFVDLAVLESYRGQGIGKGLINQLYSKVSAKTTMLQTHISDTVASSIYLKRGWEVVLPEMKVSENVSFRVFGKTL